MTASTAPQEPQTPTTPPGGKRRGPRARTSLLARGEPMLWIAGGGLAISLLMIIGLLLGVLSMGLWTFWQGPLVMIRLHDGTQHLGEVTRSETYVRESDQTTIRRRLLRIGNYEITNNHFQWIDDDEIATESSPETALLLERVEWGRFYGIPEAYLVDGKVTASGPRATWDAYQQQAGPAAELRAELVELKKHRLGSLSRREEQARLDVRTAELRQGAGSPAHSAALARQEQLGQDIAVEKAAVVARISEVEMEAKRHVLRLVTAQGQNRDLPLVDIIRAVPGNNLDLLERLGVYCSRWWEFLFDDPREANSEGGVFPAIFGTIIMTLIMIVAVVPFGVLAALYLREYAKSGPLVSAIRIAINNLAGVPSIVFGVFGLGFFSYLIGGWIDGGPKQGYGLGTWFILAAGFGLLIATGATLAVLRARLPVSERSAWAGRALISCWLGSAALLVLLIWYQPWFQGFYQAKLPNPTFGTGGILWASLTLALLSLPVVIVSTEEALASVPRSMREGSYACGASKWQTIRRIVLPRAMPGILTGTILSMARGAGEVAPLMLVGAVKLAPELPLDLHDWSGSLGWLPLGPLHPERSFMHLGFHIYDLGFQSQNSEAAKPMVFTTTLLLIGIVIALNCAAIILRARLRRRFAGNQF